MSTRCRDVYQHYYDMICARPGLTLAEYARMLPVKGSYTNLANAIANMEYWGYLLYEGPRGDLHPWEIIDRLPGDLKEIPLNRTTRWKRSGTTL
jgi:hypothetical protein